MQNLDAAAFQNFEHDSDLAEADQHRQWRAQRGLWNVDDRVANNPILRFQRDHSSFEEMIYDAGAGTPLEGAPLPKGLFMFLEQKFLPVLNIPHSKFVNIAEVARRCFYFLDMQEPYFFLVDMPVGLDQDAYRYTYRTKKTRCTLKPSSIETFQVQRGWKFPHYTAAHQAMTSPQAAAIGRGENVWHRTESRLMTKEDVLAYVCKAVYGDWDYVTRVIDDWANDFYDGLQFDYQTTRTPHDLEEIGDARERDTLFWYAVAIGLFTWLKSPHGLKFLIQYHPIYYQVLNWDEERSIPIIEPGSDGWAVVDGWTIYTAKDVERLDVEPGTCCVAGRPLHCTELVNANAVMKPCGCGKLRNITYDNYYCESGHHSKECQEWEKQNPPHMVFVSYGALANILEGRPASTPMSCPRGSCPNQKCTFHPAPALDPRQLQYMRVRELNDRRTKMLTGSTQH